MPYYPFVSDSGEQVELYYSMDDVPDIGETVEEEGIEYKRVLSRLGGVKVAQPIRSFQIRDNHPDVPHYDKEGAACFENKAQAREFAEKHNARLGGVDWVLDD